MRVFHLLSLTGKGEDAHNSEPLDRRFEVGKVESGRRYIPSASSALVIGGVLGLIQAFFLISGARPLLNFMGVKSVSIHCCKIIRSFCLLF